MKTKKETPEKETVEKTLQRHNGKINYLIKSNTQLSDKIELLSLEVTSHATSFIKFNGTKLPDMQSKLEHIEAIQTYTNETQQINKRSLNLLIVSQVLLSIGTLLKSSYSYFEYGVFAITLTIIGLAVYFLLGSRKS